MADLRRISKSLSFWLRHKPEAAGLVLDDQDWAEVEAVMAALAAKRLTEIAAGAMARAGATFRLAGNGVWLVDHVPPEHLRRL